MFKLRARRDAPPTLLAQELAGNGAASAIGYFGSLQAARVSNRTDELHLYRSTGAHGRGLCRLTLTLTPSTARCGPRGTLGAQRSSVRELHPRIRTHTMCEDWPKMALRFMRRLDFVCR